MNLLCFDACVFLDVCTDVGLFCVSKNVCFVWLQVKDGLHLIVNKVTGAGLAAGLKVGDQIMKANGVEVVTVEDLSTLIEAAPLSTGGKLELDVVRGGVQKLRLVVYVDDRRRVEDEKKQRYLHV